MGIRRTYRKISLPMMWVWGTLVLVGTLLATGWMWTERFETLDRAPETQFEAGAGAPAEAAQIQPLKGSTMNPAPLAWSGIFYRLALSLALAVLGATVFLVPVIGLDRLFGPRAQGASTTSKS